MYDPTGGRAVLLDFGLALVLRTHGSKLDVRCGSLEYNAPEMLDTTSKWSGPACDMWSLGVLAYALLCATFPFGREHLKMRIRIARGQYDKAPLSSSSADARAFVGAALDVDANSPMKVNRLSSADACKHPWLLAHVAAADAAVAAHAEADAGDPLPREALLESLRRTHDEGSTEDSSTVCTTAPSGSDAAVASRAELAPRASAAPTGAPTLPMGTAKGDEILRSCRLVHATDSG